jgi:hypothetical protein
MVAVFTSIGLEIGFSRLGLGFRKMFPDLDPYTGILYDHLLHTTLISLAGLVLLSLGKRKLSRIE